MNIAYAFLECLTSGTLWSALNQLNSTVSRVVTEVTKSREDLDTLSKKLGGTIIGNTTERIARTKKGMPLGQLFK